MQRQIHGKHQKTEAEIRVLLSQAQECLGLPEAGRAREGSTLKASERAWPCQHLGLRLLVSRIVRINFCCLQSPRLWYFCDNSSRKLVQISRGCHPPLSTPQI